MFVIFLQCHNLKNIHVTSCCISTIAADIISAASVHLVYLKQGSFLTPLNCRREGPRVTEAHHESVYPSLGARLCLFGFDLKILKVTNKKVHPYIS